MKCVLSVLFTRMRLIMARGHFHADWITFPRAAKHGAWLSYGLGTENADVPSFVVMVTKDNGPAFGFAALGQRFSSQNFKGFVFDPGKTRFFTSTIRRA